MNYDTMEAGREMDALVAEKVMGVTIVGNKDGLYWDKDHYLLAIEPFSTSISAAWEVVEKMSSTPMGAFQLTEMREGWEAHWPGVDVFAPTAPLAICRAALKAIEER